MSDAKVNDTWNPPPPDEESDSAQVPSGVPKRRGCLKTILIGALVVVLLAVVLLAGCRRGPATTMRTLSSGKTIDVISVSKVFFPESGPALILKYQTDLSIDQTVALAQEVAGIWPDFQKDAASAEVTGAAITASERPAGWPLYHMRAYKFVYIQQPDGSWKLDTSN